MDTAIIVTHWAMDDKRSEKMRICIESIIETAPEAEIIVVDNGGSLADSLYLLMQCNSGNITTYIRNTSNIGFALARNQALKLTEKKYIFISDNDIKYSKGWLEECRDYLENNNGKVMATPLLPDPVTRHKKIRWVGEKGGWKLNDRAGSNSFMMRKSDFDKIGFFQHGHKPGSKYVDKYVRMGYSMACMPKPKAIDLGLRQGYNYTV